MLAKRSTNAAAPWSSIRARCSSSREHVEYSIPLKNSTHPVAVMEEKSIFNVFNDEFASKEPAVTIAPARSMP